MRAETCLAIKDVKWVAGDWRVTHASAAGVVSKHRALDLLEENSFTHEVEDCPGHQRPSGWAPGWLRAIGPLLPKTFENAIVIRELGLRYRRNRLFCVDIVSVTSRIY